MITYRASSVSIKVSRCLAISDVAFLPAFVESHIDHIRFMRQGTNYAYPELVPLKWLFG